MPDNFSQAIANSSCNNYYTQASNLNTTEALFESSIIHPQPSLWNSLDGPTKISGLSQLLFSESNFNFKYE